MLLSKNSERLLVMLNSEYLKILRLPFFDFPIGSTYSCGCKTLSGKNNNDELSGRCLKYAAIAKNFECCGLSMKSVQMFCVDHTQTKTL